MSKSVAVVVVAVSRLLQVHRFALDVRKVGNCDRYEFDFDLWQDYAVVSSSGAGVADQY